MAALLIGLSVMAIMLSVAMPTWSHLVRREKEEELIFRGTQYARAINQYQRKYANAAPASLDILIEERMLRKKFKDPLSPNKDGEFQLLYANSEAPIAPQTGPAGGIGSRQGGSGPTTSGPTAPGQPGGPAAPGGAGTGTTASGPSLSTKPSGGIQGVASKNTGQSIKIFNEKTKYNEWQFAGSTYVSPIGSAGGAVPGGQGFPGGGPNRGGPGGRGGPPPMQGPGAQSGAGPGRTTTITLPSRQGQ